MADRVYDREVGEWHSGSTDDHPPVGREGALSEATSHDRRGMLAYLDGLGVLDAERVHRDPFAAAGVQRSSPDSWRRPLPIIAPENVGVVDRSWRVATTLYPAATRG